MGVNEIVSVLEDAETMTEDMAEVAVAEVVNIERDPIPIMDRASVTAALMLYARMKRIRKEAAEKWESLKRPAKAAYDAIRDAEKEEWAEFDENLEGLHDEIVAFENADRVRVKQASVVAHELADVVRDEAGASFSAPPAVVPEMVTDFKPLGLTRRSKYEGRVIDEQKLRAAHAAGLVPQEILVPATDAAIAKLRDQLTDDQWRQYGVEMFSNPSFALKAEKKEKK